nr:MAG TPA: 50S ribosomal protein L19 [Caudoviricetes sp.]
MITVEVWGEAEPCLNYMDLRVPFEDWMKFEYSSPNLEWNEFCHFYQDPEVEYRFQGFCEGAYFMSCYKDQQTSKKPNTTCAHSKTHYSQKDGGGHVCSDCGESLQG